MAEEKKGKTFTRKIRAPKGTTAFSYGGETYTMDKDGTLDVPHAIADELRSHGFKNADEKE